MVVAEDATKLSGHTISGEHTPFDANGDALN